MLSAYGALVSILCEGLIDSGVIPVLLGLILLSIAPSAALLKQAIPGAAQSKVDWIQGLGWVDASTPQARWHSLLLFSVVMLLAWCVKAIFSFGRIYLAQSFSQGMMRELRGRLYEHLLRQSVAFYRARQTGDLSSHVSNDVLAVQRMLNTDLVDALRGAVTILVSLAMMVTLEWRLTLIALACVPAVSAAIARSGERMRLLAWDVQRRLGDLNSFLQEKISGVETVQLFGMEDKEAATFKDINQGNYRANLRVATTMAILEPAVALISSTGMVFLVTIAGYMAIRGPLSLATLIPFAYLGQSLGSKLSLLGKIWLSTQQAAGAGDRIFAVLDTHEEVPELPDAVALPAVKGEIAFRGVSFQYRDNDPVLQDINVTIAPGRRERRGEDHPGAVAAALLRSDRGASRDRWRGPAERDAPLPAHADRDRAAGAGAVRRLGRGEHRLRSPGSEQRAGAGGGASGERRAVHRGLAAGLRHGSGGARRYALRRPAPAHRHRPCPAARPAIADPGRGDERARRGVRGPGASGAG